MKTINILILMVISVAGSLLHGADISFTEKPTAALKDGKVRITFAVSALTDITVAVKVKDGTIIRHLAAGMLGKNAPSPFTASALKQSIEWDGLDDKGKKIPIEGCSITVSAGTQTKLGKILFYEPGIAYSARAATAGPDGLVYVLQEHAQIKSTFLVQAFTREGKYVKTVMPYPANLPPERLKGLKRFKRPDSKYWPGVFNPPFRDLYPHSTGMRPQRLLVTSKNWIVLVNSSKTHNGGRPYTHRLMIVDTDGGTPLEDYFGPWTSADRICHGFCWTALSPDEKWIYTCGQRKGNSNDDGYRTPKHNVVYRIGWNDKGPAKPFIGELSKAGNDESHLNSPSGIDTDSKGNIYVCDTGNSRIAVFNPKGTWVGKIDVPMPDQVLVNKKTGAVYVYAVKRIDRRKFERKIIKFPGIGKPALYETSVPGPYCAVSLDTGTDTPMLWLAYSYWENPVREIKYRGVAKVEDKGESLTKPVLVIPQRKLPDVYQIGASPINDDVFIHSYSEHKFCRVNGKTGETKSLNLRGLDVASGPKGEVYVLHSSKKIGRYDRDGKPLPFPGTKTHIISNMPGGRYIGGHGNTASKGFSISPTGRIVVFDRDKGCGVTIFAPNGTLEKKNAIKGLNKACGSPVMDKNGNLYVATELRHSLYPEIFQGRPPSSRYLWMYGSVIKFSPQGGECIRKSLDPSKPWPPDHKGKSLIKLLSPHTKVGAAIGALWVRDGFTNAPSGGNICGCYTSRFTVDLYGRVFIPDVGQFRIHMVDPANNPILDFGDYGNEDSQGGGSKIPEPAIPLAWPFAVSVGKSGVYVSDVINRRIVRVDLVPKISQTVSTRILHGDVLKSR